MSDFAAEKELLRAVTRGQVRPEGATPDLASVLARVNWHTVLWLGRQYGVLIFLHEALKAPELARLAPPEVVAQLREFSEVHQIRALSRAGDICPVHDLFDRASIPVVLQDRTLIAHGSDRRTSPLERQSVARYAVRLADQAKAETLLATANHPAAVDPEKLIIAGRIPVLLNEGIAARPAAGRLWEQAENITMAGRTMRCLGPLHWLLQLVQNAGGQTSLPLGRAWEIASLTERMSPAVWRDLRVEAAHFDLEESTVRTIAASYRALKLSPPAFVPAWTDRPENALSTGAHEAASGSSALAPFLPTPEAVVKRMLMLAEAGPHDVVCDLGCGDGRVVIAAAKDFGARSFGVDLDPARIAEARAQAAAHGVTDRASFAVGDIFATDLGEASIVLCYLLPELQPPLLRKLRAEARRGTRVVSHEFIFPGWPPEKTELIRTHVRKISQIYLWRMP